MYRLPSIIVLLLLMFTSVLAQSPHGDELKIDCNQCHNPSGWEIDTYYISFDHNKKTEFELEGAHSQTDCKACHTTLIFKEVENQCISCHNDIHSGSVGDDCVRCHTSNTWLVDNVPEIHEENGFPLIGAHGTLNCVDCHLSETNLRFDRVGNDCISCHLEDYSTATSPDHSNFSTNCIECHNPLGTDWDSDNIGDHDFFPLTLGHDNLDCTQCHTTGNYSDADPNCVSCHQDDFDSTSDPNHNEVGFSTDCAACHTTNPGWTPADIDHDFFPLTLGHDNLDCTQCHTTGNYSDADPNCVSCHQADFDSTSDPNHNDAGFSTDCASCHTTNPGWTPANIDHDFFPLTLGHDNLDCTQCHTTGNYSDTDPNCVSCHQADFDSTSDPNHNEVGFSTDCASCHTTNPGWTPANIDHDFFPLTLGHDNLDCTQCHTTGNYSDADPNCVSCHQADFDSTSDPNHNDAGFSTDCASCHTTNPGWTPANIDHDFFPLTLGHDNLDCTQCHTTGNYSDTDPNCVSCHQDDYNNTNDPNHSSAQFPTDCIECHTTNPGWSPTTWDHDGQYFPIYSGRHNNEWDQCIECHIDANDYSTFSCVDCHEHDNQNEVDNDHSEVNGYVYESNACLECHPDGNN